MNVVAKSTAIATALLLVTEPIAFGQNGSTPPHPTDISGYWLMEFGTCKGSINVSPPLKSVGGKWNGIWTGQCGSDSLRVQYIISVSSHDTLGSNFEIYEYEEYNFSGSGSFSNGVAVTETLDMNWTPYKTALAGSGFFVIGSAPKRQVSASMHR